MGTRVRSLIRALVDLVQFFYFLKMFSRTATVVCPLQGQARGMATLRDINNRLKAVTNIQKITKAVKITSASKFAQAERALRPLRAYGAGAQAFYEKAEIEQDPAKKKHLIVAMSSDRGLCGGIHSNIFKMIRSKIQAQGDDIDVKIIAVGDKQKGLLGRWFADKIVGHFIEVGRKPPTFGDAASVAEQILATDYEFGELYFNKFKSAIAYTTTAMPIFSIDAVSTAEKINLYDSIDEDTVQSYSEFQLASKIFYAFKEGTTSEMIDSLTLLYNRKRQGVITTELIEIISGAAAL